MLPNRKPVETVKDREEMANHWRNGRGRVMDSLREYMEIYSLRKVNEFGECFAGRIKEGCAQFKIEMERHLLNADERFGKLIEELRIAMGAIGRKFHGYDGGNAEVEYRIQHLTTRNQQKRY